MASTKNKFQLEFPQYLSPQSSAIEALAAGAFFFFCFFCYIDLNQVFGCFMLFLATKTSDVVSYY